MHKNSHQSPRRVLRREVVFVGEEDWLPNDDIDIDTSDGVGIGAQTCQNTPHQVTLTRQASIYNNRPFCRICLSEEDDHSEKGRLFRPCRCRGSMRFVHNGCLEEWRRACPRYESTVQCEHCSFSYKFKQTSLTRRLVYWAYVTTLTTTLFYAYVVLYGLPMKIIVHMLDLTNNSVVYVAEGTHVSIRHAYELVRPMTLQVLYTVDTTHLLLGLLLFGLVSVAGFPGFGLVCMSLLQFRTHSPPRNQTAEFRTCQTTLAMLAIWGAAKGIHDLYKEVRHTSSGKLPSQEQVVLDAGSP